ncbi:MAG: hypothetical protein K2O85_07910 [Helicobacter sp.]|nr:hypothetical protein [Helicobacter sp.]
MAINRHGMLGNQRFLVAQRRGLLRILSNPRNDEIFRFAQYDIRKQPH